MRTALISMLFLVGMMFVHTQAFAVGSFGQSSTVSNQGAVKAQGVTLSGHVIPAVKALPEKRFSPDSILIRFRQGISANDKAMGRQKVKGKKLRAYSLVPGLEHLRIGIPGLEVEEAIRILERLPFVKYAQPNYVITINKIPNDANFTEQWALHNTGGSSAFGEWGPGIFDADIDAPEAWDTITGSEAPVAIIDTGIFYDHPDLVNNMWTNTAEYNGSPDNDDDGNGYVDDIHGWDFANNDNDPFDGLGHGTHIAGIVAAEGNNGVSVPDVGGGACGVLWSGHLMALKAIGDDGWGYLAHAIAALEYAVDKGARISNSSWGYYDYTGEEEDHLALRDAILAAQSHNHLFIAAAGNGDNQGSPGWDTDVTVHYPSGFDLDNIISVAATDWNDDLAYFSNYGELSVDLAAPGFGIYSTYYSIWTELFGIPDYAWLSGTSMATPHVTGVVAMVTEQHPDWTYSQIRNRILDTTRWLTALNGKTVSGGILNAANAVAVTGNPPAANFDFVTDDFTVTFTDQSENTDGTVVAWNWDFDDGESSTVQNPVHTYAGYSNYNVTLTVTDNEGASDYITKEVTVTEPPNNPPMASFTYVCTGWVCDFDGSGSYDSEGPIASYYWDFGDGYSAYIESPSHNYTADNSYTVSLTVTDGDGAIDTHTQDVPVTASSDCNNNGTCEAGEDCNSCPDDCISDGGGGGCGNGVCEPTESEDCISCPEDCRGKQVGAAKRQFCCGDGDGTNPKDCSDPRCSEEGWLCTDTLPDPYCCGINGCTGGEDGFNCAIDCGLPETNCNDTLDNDGDTYVDCDDPDCDGDASCTSCLFRGETCIDDNECCSGDCHPIKGTCK